MYGVSTGFVCFWTGFEGGFFVSVGFFCYEIGGEGVNRNKIKIKQPSTQHKKNNITKNKSYSIGDMKTFLG